VEIVEDPITSLSPPSTPSECKSSSPSDTSERRASVTEGSPAGVGQDTSPVQSSTPSE
ncbi:hypothetical protein Pmar_PMAR022956, partial [Perkinsus marinus ATCC 50983]